MKRRPWIPATLFLMFFLPARPTAAQTNDPLVGQQQYLFDVHKIDQAWNVTTGSSDVQIGLYSMLGFIQSHEDLSASRVLAPQGGPVVPDLDVGSEMVGIVGATANNGKGMTGIDRNGKLQSYSILRQVQGGDNEDNIIEFTRTNGTVEKYYLDPLRFGELLETGRTNGIDVYLFSFGIPAGDAEDFPLDGLPDADLGNFSEPPQSPSLLDQFFGILRGRFDTIFNTLCGGIFGSCQSPPDPVSNFRTAIGNAVKLGNGVIVSPAGDLAQAGETTIDYMPGLMNKYAIAVGGIKKDAGGNLLAWDRTRPSDYVDVAAFAENVVGLSGTGSNQYNTTFGGTAAAASIGAGVAALLKAVHPDLTSEDVEEVLKRTAFDTGAPGRDAATGNGAIDAKAALDYVINNDVQRVAKPASSVLNDTDTGTVRSLQGTGYWAYIPSNCSSYTNILGTEHTFTARVNFAQAFATTPDVWVRWAASDGIDTRFKLVDGELVATFDPFEKAISVSSTDATGFTVSGSYWYARFFNAQGQECPTKNNIPALPQDFLIAYTAVGTEATPQPLAASITGPSLLNSGDSGTWNANPSGGSDPYTYSWQYFLSCPGGAGPEGRHRPPGPRAVECGQWQSGGNGATFSLQVGAGYDPTIQLTVTDLINATVTATKTVTVAGGAGGARVEQAAAPVPSLTTLSAETLPARYALEQNHPNPFNPSTEIRFYLPESGPISLIIYDVTGRAVRRLIHSVLPAGTHRISFDAASLPSGVYLYRITAGTFTETRRMTLLK